MRDGHDVAEIISTSVQTDASRRFALKMLAGSIILGGVRAYAQPFGGESQINLDQAQLIAELASDFYMYVLEKDFDDDESILSFVSLDYQSRRDTLDLVRQLNVPLSGENVFLVSLELVQLIRPQYSEVPYTSDQFLAVSQIANEAPIDVVIPRSDLVTPIGVPSVLAASSTEGNFRVIGDIFIETIGMGLSEEGLFVAFLESEPLLQANFEALLNSVATKDWQEVAALLEGIFLLMLTTSWWVAVRQKLGQRLTLALGLRCVPVVGWAYMIGAFVVSIKRNYSRFSFA